MARWPRAGLPIQANLEQSKPQTKDAPSSTTCSPALVGVPWPPPGDWLPHPDPQRQETTAWSLPGPDQSKNQRGTGLCADLATPVPLQLTAQVWNCQGTPASSSSPGSSRTEPSPLWKPVLSLHAWLFFSLRVPMCIPASEIEVTCLSGKGRRHAHAGHNEVSPLLMSQGTRSGGKDLGIQGLTADLTSFLTGDNDQYLQTSG